MAVTEPSSAREKTNRTLLTIGATGTLFGIALSTGEQPTVGGAVTLLGLAVTIYGLHRFGRTGSDRGPARPKRRKAA